MDYATKSRLEYLSDRQWKPLSWNTKNAIIGFGIVLVAVLLTANIFN
jgi:hypothetical protein